MNNISTKYNQKKWTNKEIQSLKLDYLSFVPKKEMVKKYCRNWDNIRVKANSINLKRGQPQNSIRYSLPLSKIEITNLYKKGLSTIQIANKCNCSASNISDILKRMGCKIRSESVRNRIYPINETFFDIIDIQEKAYFLGILYADGYNNADRGSIALTLVENDKEILVKLNNLLQPTKPLQYIKLKNRNNVYRLNIDNKYISQKLSELGCVQAKTFKIIFPEWLDEKLYPHFIRGYFDGDGCITNGKNPAFSIVGTEQFLIEIQNILIRELGLNKTKFQKRHKERKNNITSLICAGRNNCQKIYNYLYENSRIFLERKQKKFLNNFNVTNKKFKPNYVSMVALTLLEK